MLPSNKNKGPRACATCAKAKSRCIPSTVPDICERCHRLGKQCGSQTPAPPKRRRTDGAATNKEGTIFKNAAGSADAAAAAVQAGATSSTAGPGPDGSFSHAHHAPPKHPKGTKPTRVAELERRLEDLTSRLESVSRQQQQAQQATLQQQQQQQQQRALPTPPANHGPTTQQHQKPVFSPLDLFRAGGSYNLGRHGPLDYMFSYERPDEAGKPDRKGPVPSTLANALAQRPLPPAKSAIIPPCDALPDLSGDLSTSNTTSSHSSHGEPLGYMFSYKHPDETGQPDRKGPPDTFTGAADAVIARPPVDPEISPANSTESPASSSAAAGSVHSRQSGQGQNSQSALSQMSSTPTTAGADMDTTDLPMASLFPSAKHCRRLTPPGQKLHAAAAGVPTMTIPLETPGIPAPGTVQRTAAEEAAAKLAKQTMWPKDDEAKVLLAEYRANLMPLFPFVVFPSDVTANQLKASHPFVWKAFMMEACHMDGARQILMGEEVLEDLVKASLLQPRRSVDVLQAMLVVVSWFHYNINSFQMNNVLFLLRALCVALGIGNGPPGNASLADQGADPADPRAYGASALEKMRAFAGTYYVVTHISSTTKKSDPMLSTPYLDMCLRVLEARQESPTDVYLVQLVRVQQLSQSISIAFSMRGTGMAVDLSATFLVEHLEKQVEAYKAQVPEYLRNDPAIVGHVYISEILLYDVALQDDKPSGAMSSVASPLSRSKNSTALTPTERLHLLWACLRATRGFLENRFAEPISDQPRFVCISSFDFMYAFLTALKLMTQQNVPGWDPRRVREELQFDALVDRQILDMQMMAEQRTRKRRKEEGGNESRREDAGDKTKNGNVQLDPFDRLVRRLRELKQMIGRELDRIPAHAGAGASMATAEAVQATSGSAQTPGTQQTGLTGPTGQTPYGMSTDTSMETDAYPVDGMVTDMTQSLDLNGNGMHQGNDPLAVSDPYFTFADSTLDYIQSFDGVMWPDLLNAPGWESYMDANMNTPPILDGWDP